MKFSIARLHELSGRSFLSWNQIMLSLTMLTTAATFPKSWKAVQRAAYLSTDKKVNSSLIFPSKHNSPKWPTKLRGHQHSQPPVRAHGASRPRAVASEVPCTAPPFPAHPHSQWDDTGFSFSPGRQLDTKPAGSPRVSYPATQFPPRGSFQPLQPHTTGRELGSGLFPGSKPEEGRMGYPHPDLT